MPAEGYYDRWTDLFLEEFGPIFQAGVIRTGDPPREDPEASVLEIAKRAGVESGQAILDAGCGVGGPATIIAGHYADVHISGVTPSERQVSIGNDRVHGAGLAQRVRIQKADYHDLPFPGKTFDLILFLESTGYAWDLDLVFGEAARALKPGGRLYIKDVFCRGGTLTQGERRQMATFDQLWGCERSKTVDESVKALQEAGFIGISSRSMPEVGTYTLLGAMFDLTPGGLELGKLGAEFWRRDLRPPIEFGEVIAHLAG